MTTVAAPTGKSSPKATELRLRRMREAANASVSGGPSVTTLMSIALERISPSALNPRKRFDEASLQDLAASIRAVGVLQPIVVREATPGSYELVAGERRWRAAGLAGLAEVPAVLLEGVGTAAVLQASIVENVQRADLTADEEARAYKALLESGMTQKQVGELVGVSQSRVAHRLKLLLLPDDVQALLAEGKLSGAHGEALARFADFPKFVTVLAAVAVEQDPPLSARELAQPFNFDAVMDDDRFETLYDGVGYAVVQKAQCFNCQWNAFVPDAQTGWCLRPEHIKEVEALLREEQHQVAQQQKAGIEWARETAVQAVRAAATAPPPASPPVLEVGDRVRHTTLGEGSVLEAKPHAVLIKIDDGGKEFWQGLNAHGGGHIQVLDGTGATLGEPPPQLPDYNSLPRGTAELLKYLHPVPAPCAARSCECFGQVRYYGDVEGVCTRPGRLKAMQTRLKSAITSENKRRHAEAIAVLDAFVDGRLSDGVRELALIARVLVDGQGYRPNGTSMREMWKQIAPEWMALDMETMATQASSESALTSLLVKAICRQDLAMRFHPDGGASYGELTSWYVGKPLPERTPNDWLPEKALVKT